MSESVILTQWVHPFPFRTRKLSAAVVKILGWRRPGKIAHSRHNQGKLNKFPLIFFIRPAKTDKTALLILHSALLTLHSALLTLHSIYSSLAQSVEHLTVNQGVTGSSPVGGAKTKRSPNGLRFCFAFFPTVLEHTATLRAKGAYRGKAAKRI